MQNRKEKWLAFALIMPSIIAVGIFVYGFIGWTTRVSFSAWRGMTPDYTFINDRGRVPGPGCSAGSASDLSTLRPG